MAFSKHADYTLTQALLQERHIPWLMAGEAEDDLASMKHGSHCQKTSSCDASSEFKCSIKAQSMFRPDLDARSKLNQCSVPI